MEAIPPISNIPSVSTQSQTIVEVSKTADGRDKITNKYYEVVLYDHIGRLYTARNMYTLDYLI